jgi:hypothetical protein
LAAGGTALVGELVVSARAEPRLTRDVDLAVAVETDDEAKAMLHRPLCGGFATVTT